MQAGDVVHDGELESALEARWSRRGGFLSFLITGVIVQTESVPLVAEKNLFSFTMDEIPHADEREMTDEIYDE